MDRPIPPPPGPRSPNPFVVVREPRLQVLFPLTIALSVGLMILALLL